MNVAALPLTTTDAVAQSDVDLAGQLLIDEPQGQCAELQQVNNEAADHENVADEEVAQELGLQQLQEAHFPGKRLDSVNGWATSLSPAEFRQHASPLVSD